jgi:anthranilate synthase component 1
MRYVPSLDEFRAAAERGNLVPVYREILADQDTPVSAYAKLGRGEGTFLLESVVGGAKWAAYSFIGARPRALFTAGGGRYEIVRYDDAGGGPVRHSAPCPNGDPTEALAGLIGSFRAVPVPGLPRFFGGAVGYFGYDVVRAFEKLPADKPDELGLPEAVFVLTDTLVVFDNLRQTIKVVANALCDRATDAEEAYRRACARVDEVVARLHRPAPPLRALSPDPADAPEVPLSANRTRADYEAAVERAKEYIRAGDVFQVVLSQRFQARLDGVDPFDVYRALRVVNPSPYMFHLELPGMQVTGASPEVLARLEEGKIALRPIAGTRPRGATLEEDARLEAELRADPKELAEHVMLIDLARNDVGRVAETGSVRVDERFVVERYSHVMHLVSHVSGTLTPGRKPLDVLRACFPAGTLSGAPKIRAMEIIEALEPCRRGLYGGAVGYVAYPVDGTSNLDFAIAIRTLLQKGGTAYVQAGAGIVADSDPAAEYEESLNKARAVLRALAMARGGR